MSYYITAHRYNSKFNVPIEEKHKYITDGLNKDDDDVVGVSQALPETIIQKPQNTFILYKPAYSTYINGQGESIKTNSNSVSGLNLISNYVKLFYRPSMLKIEQGTGARQRIGDKIYLKSVQIMLNLSATRGFYDKLLGNGSEVSGTIVSPYATGFSGEDNLGTIAGTITTDASLTTELYLYKNKRMNTKQFMKFRIMIIRFDDLSDSESKNEADLQLFIRNWFNEIYVPLAIVPAAEGNYVDIPVVSNQSKMLRESTQYTGSFTKLYDEMVELNQNDFSKYIKINLEPKINLTFKDSDNTPTTENFNNVFGFIIPPTYYKTDMDIVSYNEFLRGKNANLSVAEFTTNIKFTYYDM